MLVIPAIDLKDGLCVRLRQGDFTQQTVYSDDPVHTAAYWQSLGAKWLHLVDLDGAIEGRSRNFSQIGSIRKAVSIHLQVGGGIRTMETIRRYISSGVDRVVLGTAVLENPALLEEACREYPEQILVGLDARDGKVAVRGWTSVSQKTVVDLVADLKGYRLAGLIYTDIARDGMLAGPNLVALRDVTDRSPVPVIASGGITRVDDLRAIKSLGPRISGAIIGKALYDGKLTLQQAMAAVASC